MTATESGEDPCASEPNGEELIEVVRNTVTDLERLLDRLRRYVDED